MIMNVKEKIINKNVVNAKVKYENYKNILLIGVNKIQSKNHNRNL